MKAFLVLCLIALATCQLSGPTTGRGAGVPAPFSAAPAAAEYRMITGLGNNIQNPLNGVSGTALRRVANNPNGYQDLISIPRGGLINSTLPNARAISTTVFAFSGGLNGGQFNPQNANGFTAWSTFFGQFEDHDLSLSPEIQPRGLAEFNVEVPIGDIFFDPLSFGNLTIVIERFQFDNTTGLSPANPRNQINIITGTVDLNNVYGSDNARALALRLQMNGLLNTTLVNGAEFLPFNDQINPTTGMPFANGMPGANRAFAGDVRADENVALNSVHTLFVREHNRIAREIVGNYPGASDTTLYEEARRRNIALLQNVLYNEWFPQYLGELFSQYAYDSSRVTQATIENTHMTFRFGHTMLANVIHRRDAQNATVGQGDIMLQNAFFQDPTINVNQVGLDAYLLGLTQQTQNEVDNFVVDAVRNFLFGPPGPEGLDLITINIQRGREVGIPSYNILRQAYGLAVVANFAGVNPDVNVQARLNAAYPNGIADCDGFVCGIAEPLLVGNGINANLGPLFRNVILQNWNDMRLGDRLWFENQQFTAADLQNTIYPTVMADIIQRNSGIAALQCFAFASRDGCAIGNAGVAVPSQRPATPVSAADFVFNIVQKTNAHSQAALGSRFGYTVQSSNSALTAGGEGASLNLLVNTQYTFASDAACTTRLYITSTPAGGRDTAVTPAINGNDACLGRTFTWTPTSTGTFYYASRFQLNAGGQINVVNVLPQTTTTSLAGMLVANVAAIVAAILAFFF